MIIRRRSTCSGMLSIKRVIRSALFVQTFRRRWARVISPYQESPQPKMENDLGLLSNGWPAQRLSLPVLPLQISKALAVSPLTDKGTYESSWAWGCSNSSFKIPCSLEPQCSSLNSIIFENPSLVWVLNELSSYMWAKLVYKNRVANNSRACSYSLTKWAYVNAPSYN